MKETVRKHMYKFYDYFKEKQLEVSKGVIYLSTKEVFAEQEKAYLKIRSIEGRLYSDDIVRKLPYVEDSHIQKNEWLIRSQSLEKVSAYLSNLKKSLIVLDIGCGNGWMANNLSEIPNIELYCLDVNAYELEQGRRVFKEKANIIFLYGNVFGDVLPIHGFDFILLSSSIQYFSDLKSLLDRLQELLTPTGEIHILDTIFYASNEIVKAKERSYIYYKSKDVLDMNKYYFHHTLDVFTSYKHKILTDPRKISNKISNKFSHNMPSPFYWIVIMK